MRSCCQHRGIEITYPGDLPITERRQELLDTIRDHQVVVVAGETGSGKSTQLPKLCLELGRGSDGWIGHTQPRRIAARSIAERVAEELGTELGGVVGYAVRFTDKVTKTTKVKLMTDGILLAEIQRDRQLTRYDTIIIDEAHERSLNVDFLLGYLRQLLPRRPDLKLIITSATIDTERFAAHFDNAPIVTVSGRAYPVEVRYRPLDHDKEPDEEPRDQPEGICDAVTELVTEADGDILVFCSGEREIRDAADALADLRLPDTEVLTLYARLPSAEQHRVFEPHKRRRIIIATNVAETSLTVPGIHCVVDAGTARISRYSKRTKVQRLPIEAVSQASANQRSGRCGRLGPGVCIRLYSEDDFNARPEFTEPEIQRTNLASVILAMAAIGLGDIEAFPFVDPPDRANIGDGLALLEELDAIRPGQFVKLTPIGRTLAKLPVDPRLGRMLISADENGCLTEVLVIAAGLSIQDPRDRPQDKQQAADELHARFADPDSDFIGFLNLWDHLRTERRSGSSSRFRRVCRREFLNYPRVREWQDIHTQLRRACEEQGMRRNDSPSTPELVHRAVLTGLLSHVGTKDKDSFEYRGARNAKFAIAPGSSMFRSGPRWLMAAELVETNRLWARVVTRTKPEWIEEAAEHLVKRSYTDPHWDAERGAAVAKESVSLYGLPLIGGRTVLWGRVDEADARDLFIRHALLAGEWDSSHGFVAHNIAQVEQVHELEARARRADVLVDEESLVEWFGARIPSGITSVRHFDSWWKEAQAASPKLLHLSIDDLTSPEADLVDTDAFPNTWHHGDLEFELSYEFDTSSPTDGVTINIPVSAIGRVEAATFEWLVPGLRGELVAALVRSMPKQLRKAFVPLPQTIEAVLPHLEPAAGRLLETLPFELARYGGVSVPPDAFDPGDLPLYLQPNFCVVDNQGRPLAHGGDLDALKSLLDDQVMASLKTSPHELERSAITDWDFAELPRTVQTRGSGHVVTAYPALVDNGETIAVQLLATEDEQHHAMWAGTRRLLLLNRPPVSKPLRALLTNEVKLALVQSPYPSPSDWFEDLLGCAVDQLMIEADAPVWNEPDWALLLSSVRERLPSLITELGPVSASLLRRLREVQIALEATTAPSFTAAVDDMTNQLDSLFYPGFLTGLGARNLANVDRYLRTTASRLERLPENPRRDADSMRRIHALEKEHGRLVELLPWSQELEDLAWQLQELRVSLFAQSVGAKGQVSEKRIRKALVSCRERLV